MTVIENTSPKIQYTGTFILNQQLTINFPYTNREDIHLRVNDEEAEYNVDYSILEQTLTLKKEYGQAEITIYRDTPLDQQANFPQNNRFDSAKLNESLDKICMQQQEQQEAISRSLKASISTVNFDGTLPPPEPNKMLKINEDGTGFKLSEFDAETIALEVQAIADEVEEKADEVEENTQKVKTDVASINTSVAHVDSVKAEVDNKASYFEEKYRVPTITYWSDNEASD